jgi:hypothetical protein
MPECQPLPNKRFGRLSQIESFETRMHPCFKTLRYDGKED